MRCKRDECDFYSDNECEILFEKVEGRGFKCTAKDELESEMENLLDEYSMTKSRLEYINKLQGDD